MPSWPVKVLGKFCECRPNTHVARIGSYLMVCAQCGGGYWVVPLPATTISAGGAP